ncbi:MAG: hypothetical protein VX385_03005 [Acidobacteriota bacterium]|nr:hypothetical protein [Acidobacteriota bacterium]
MQRLTLEPAPTIPEQHLGNGVASLLCNAFWPSRLEHIDLDASEATRIAGDSRTSAMGDRDQ